VGRGEVWSHALTEGEPKVNCWSGPGYPKPDQNHGLIFKTGPATVVIFLNEPEPEVPPKSRELPNTGANVLKVVVKAGCYNDAEDQ
jgi:hypothetical protein